MTLWRLDALRDLHILDDKTSALSEPELQCCMHWKQHGNYSFLSISHRDGDTS
jgi:hypothetical protein